MFSFLPLINAVEGLLGTCSSDSSNNILSVLVCCCPHSIGDDRSPWNVSEGLQNCTGKIMNVHWHFTNKLLDPEMGQESGLSVESWAYTPKQSLAASYLCHYGTFTNLECVLLGLVWDLWMNLTCCIREDNNKRAVNVQKWFEFRHCQAFCSITEWALRQVSRHSLVKQTACRWLWRFEMFTAECGKRRWATWAFHPL